MGKLSAAVVGLRGHAGRHIEMLGQNPDVELKWVYYHREPPSESAHLPVTNDISDCMDSDVVIISSPTPLHFQQLEALSGYDGYVLLEKPAVTAAEEIRRLLELAPRLKSRIFVNYNFMFHDLAGLLGELASGPEMGDVFALEVHSNHGGAFTSGWHDSWRRRKGGLNIGALETVGIHYIHFALTQFGECRNAIVRTGSLSRKGEAVDTGMVSMRMESGMWVSIYCSYAAPYAFRVQMWGTNGYLTYDGKEVAVYSPRDTFDENGLFAEPPVDRSRQLDFEPGWSESLVRSQRHLLAAAREHRDLDPADFDRDVSAVNVLLDARRLD